VTGWTEVALGGRCSRSRFAIGRALLWVCRCLQGRSESSCSGPRHAPDGRVQDQRRSCTRSAGGQVWGSRDVCLVGEAGWCLCYGVVGRNAASSAQQIGKDPAAGGLRSVQWAVGSGRHVGARMRLRAGGRARRGLLRDGDGGAVNASVRTLRLQGGDVLSGISVFLAPKFNMLRAFLCSHTHTRAQSTH
jgi:hypothetical protein